MIWYTRAALRDNRRAQYNLALMIEAGSDGRSDPGRAVFWYRQAAASLPAAAARLRSLKDANAPNPARRSPDLLFHGREAGLLELAWAPDGSGDLPFEIEMLAVPRDGKPYRLPVAAVETRATGLLMTDPAPGTPLAIRIVTRDIGAHDYKTSGWIEDVGPVGRVTFELGGTNPALRRFVDVLAADLRRAGMWIRMDAPIPVVPPSTDPDVPQSATEVVYGWQSDSDLASAVASLLPGISKDATRFSPASDLDPGEVRVRVGSDG